MNVKEASQDPVSSVKLKGNRLWICDKDGWIKGDRVEVKR